MPNFLATLKEKLSNAKGKLVAAGFIGLNTVNAVAADVAIGSDGAVTGSIDPKNLFWYGYCRCRSSGRYLWRKSWYSLASRLARFDFLDQISRKSNF